MVTAWLNHLEKPKPNIDSHLSREHGSHLSRLSDSDHFFDSDSPACETSAAYKGSACVFWYDQHIAMSIAICLRVFLMLLDLLRERCTDLFETQVDAALLCCDLLLPEAQQSLHGISPSRHGFSPSPPALI